MPAKTTTESLGLTAPHKDKYLHGLPYTFVQQNSTNPYSLYSLGFCKTTPEQTSNEVVHVWVGQKQEGEALNTLKKNPRV